MATFTFGSWHWMAHERVLLRSGSAVRLGSRAREILALLLEKPGALVSTDQIVEQVWPGTLVVEVALRVHVAHLRRILRDGPTCYIQNIRGVGYRFVPPSPRPPACADMKARSPGTDVIGRASFIAAVQDRIVQQSLVTIVGPGGVGKSVVALAAAEALRESYGVNVQFVDLLAIKSTAQLRQSIDAALAKGAGSRKPRPGNQATPDPRDRLLLVDNCDHWLEAAASCFERALQRAPRLRILATCRGPLGANHEHVLRLRPLELPAGNAQLCAAEAMRFPAIELFVRRARACGDDFELNDANAPVVARICSQLDGLPLPIDLAALRVHELGLAGLSAPAEVLLDLLTRGRRTSPPHHRSLRGLLDHSCGFLSANEQRALRRLAELPGEFDIGEAAAVVADDLPDARRIYDIITQLRAASLIEVHGRGGSMTYELLNIHRAYALSHPRPGPAGSEVRGVALATSH